MEIATSDNKSVSLFTRFVVDIEEEATLRGILGEYVKEELDTPLMQEQLKYFVTWHEHAHLTGCLEPQADMIGAIMTRQAIDNPVVLEIFADSRMVDTLFNSEELLEKYGWQTAQAFDYVLSMD